MTSMTGHAWGEWQGDDYSATIEVKSYNNRYLDLNLQLPHGYTALEPLVRAQVSDAAERGKIECSIRCRSYSKEVRVSVDEDMAREYVRALRRVASLTDTRSEPTAAEIVAFDGVLVSEQNINLDHFWTWIEPKLGEVLGKFRESREVEGRKLRTVIERELQGLNRLVESVSWRSDDLQNYLRENIRSRFADLRVEGIDDSRILSETAVLLVKYSIREEIDRLNAHLSAFSEALDGEGAIGKRLDFICQEIGREINTIGSKSVFEDINAAVVDAKNALENIREQLRNIE